MGAKQVFAKIANRMTGRWSALQFTQTEIRKKDPGREWYAVKAEDLYPQTITRILQAIQADGLPAELLDDNSPLPEGVANSLLFQARAIPRQSWEMALTSAGGLSNEDRAARRAALEVARLWFTQTLHVECDGRPIGLHILDDPGSTFKW